MDIYKQKVAQLIEDLKDGDLFQVFCSHALADIMAGLKVLNREVVSEAIYSAVTDIRVFAKEVAALSPQTDISRALEKLASYHPDYFAKLTAVLTPSLSCKQWE